MSSWPAVLRVPKPFTMCHVLRLVDPSVDCRVLGSPGGGGVLLMDLPGGWITSMFDPPVAVVAQAARAGVRLGPARAPGLVEALQRSRAGAA